MIRQKLAHAILFSYERIVIMRSTARTVSVSDFNMNWKGFKQYLIVSRYLRVVLNGLPLLRRHQNIVNEVKNQSKMAGSSLI